MFGILGTRQHSVRPDYPWAFNKDCAQAQGLVAWWPLGQSITPYDRGPQGKFSFGTNTDVTLDTCQELGRVHSVATAVDTTAVLEHSAAVLTAHPTTFMCWGKLATNPVVVRNVLSVDRSAGGDHYLQLGLTTGGIPAARVRAGSTAAAAAAPSAMIVGQLHHLAALFESTTSRYGGIDGLWGTQSTTSRNPTSMDRTRFGIGPNSDQSRTPCGWFGDLRIYNRAIRGDDLREYYDPNTRWDLYYPIGRKTWSFAPPATITITPSPLSSAVTLVAPVVTTGQNIAAGPLTVQANLWAPAIAVGNEIAPTPLQAAASIVAPTVEIATVVSPNAVQAAATLVAPTVTVGNDVSATPLQASCTLVAPTVSIGTEVAPSPLTATGAIVAPLVEVGQQVATSPLTAAATLVAPAIVLSNDVSLSPLSASATLIAPVVTGGLEPLGGPGRVVALGAYVPGPKAIGSYQPLVTMQGNPE